MGPVAQRSNLSSTKRTVAALRRGSRLGPEHIALVGLAETTAKELDEVVDGEEKCYVVAQLARAHLLTLEALRAACNDDHLDPFAAF
jgi:hypothetical protein